MLPSFLLVLLTSEFKNYVGPLDAISYTWCQSTNVIGELRSTGVFCGSMYQLRVPLNFSVTGSSTPWKVMAPSPMAFTVWLAHVREIRGYLWDGLIVGGSTLVGDAGSSIDDRHCVTVGGTLRGAWGLALTYSVGTCVSERVCLRGAVGLVWVCRKLQKCRLTV